MVMKQILAAVLLLGANVIANPMAGKDVEPVDKRAAPDSREKRNLMAEVGATTVDATTADATTVDATTVDATTVDATTVDATTADATTADATTADATTADATTADATTADATTADATTREKKNTMVVADMMDMVGIAVTTAGMEVAGTDRLASTLTTSGKYRHACHACHTLPLIITVF
ncbi:NADH-dependent flavin oxidoreductase [Apiospora arundinis]